MRLLRQLFEKLTDLSTGNAYDFTFDLRDNCYAVSTDHNGVLSIVSVEYSVFGGYKTSPIIPDDDAIDIALSIYRRSAANPTRYPLCSEHYKATVYDNGNNKRLRVTKGNGRPFSPLRRVAALASCIFVTACVLYVLALVLIYGLKPIFMHHLPGDAESTLDFWIVIFLFAAAFSAFVSTKVSTINFYTLGVFAPCFIMEVIHNMDIEYSPHLSNIAIVSLIIGGLYFIYTGVYNKFFLKNIGRFFFKICVLSLAVSCIFCIAASTKSDDDSNTDYIELRETVSAEYDDATTALVYESWDKLPDDRRLDILQKVAAYEAVFTLGIPIPRVVSTKLKSDELGISDHISNTIQISAEHIAQNDVYYVVRTLLHELRHMWQYKASQFIRDLSPEITEKYRDFHMIREFVEYDRNLYNYISPEQDKVKYYNQTVESDSRRWASEHMKENYYFIKEPDEEIISPQNSIE